MHVRFRFSRCLGSLALGGLVLIQACGPAAIPADEPTASKQDKAMALPSIAADEIPSIPPIDAAAPAHYATATFALG